MAETPIIKPIEKLSTLYDAFQDSKRVLGAGRVSTRDTSGLDGLVTHEAPYLAVANSLNAMRVDLGQFRKRAEETLEYAIKYIRGQFNGRSEAEIRSVSALLGLIPITTSAGESRGKIEGDVDFGVYDFEKLTNTVPSTHQWLKDFLTQYTAEVNNALEGVPEGEVNQRLKVELDRVNNAMEDCYNEGNVTRLKFASQNLTGGLTALREMMFPLHSEYPERGNFLGDTGKYVEAVKSLREFAQGKEKVSFYMGGLNDVSTPYKFKDATPRANRSRKKILGIF